MTEFYAWELEPLRRGTFSIIITCLSTLGFCVWSAIHLSIPRQVPTRMQRAGTQILWVSIGLLLPELLIIAALSQRKTAGKLRDTANKAFGFDGSRELSRSTRREMDEDEEKTLNSDDESDEYPLREHRWTLVHGFYAKMGGFALKGGPRKPLTILSVGDITTILHSNPQLIPDIPEIAILNQSKADGLAKALLFIQVGWFCINSLSRLIQHLPLTLIEVTTLAHAFCSLSAYGLWWDKPLNIHQPMIIDMKGATGKFNIDEVRGRSEGRLRIELSHAWDTIGLQTTMFVGVGVGLVYGSPHLLAWSNEFPTHTEQVLWRVSSLVVTTSSLIVAVVGYILLFLDLGEMFSNLLIYITFFLLSLAYFPASLYLIAESFRQTLHLPPKAFEVPIWSNYFPHFS